MQKTVYCYNSNGDFIEKYKSARSLDRKYNLFPDSFRKHIDTGKIYRGFVWSYKSEGINIDDIIEEKAKILIFDIETAPRIGYFWQVWKQNVMPHMLKDDWHVLTWSAKWLQDIKIISDKATAEEAKNKDDKRIVESLWKLFDEADI